MGTEILVVGAGISGLACAQALVEAGKSVLVLEKSRGVGGRCATRRVENSIVDHGLTFFHGDDPELRAALERAGGEDVVDGWPRIVRGTGVPCQRSAFRDRDWRLALSGGMTVFPKQLASGIDLRLNTRATTLEPDGARWKVADATGQVTRPRDLVLAIPVPQALELLDSWAGKFRAINSVRMLLGEIGFGATLTVIALYSAEGAIPDWEIWFPEDSTILQLISHDSSKRNRPERTALVLQALPSWSRRQWERPESEWSAAMIEEAGRLAGPWATAPQLVQTHRWRFARIGSGGDLSGPLMLELDGGRRIGFVGDGFSPGGGVQAAWRSGRELALRLLEDR